MLIPEGFTSSFVAIPLPQVFHKQFKDLLTEIKVKFLLFEVSPDNNPHITVCYLLEESIGKLRVEQSIKRNLPLLKDARIEITGFDYFRPGYPKVLFWDVQSSDGVTNFYKALNKELEMFTAPENLLAFRPHLTLANVKMDPQFNIDEVKKQLSPIKIDFLVEEIRVFGADATKIPEYQEELQRFIV